MQYFCLPQHQWQQPWFHPDVRATTVAWALKKASLPSSSRTEGIAIQKYDLWYLSMFLASWAHRRWNPVILVVLKTQVLKGICWYVYVLQLPYDNMYLYRSVLRCSSPGAVSQKHNGAVKPRAREGMRMAYACTWLVDNGSSLASQPPLARRGLV